jgi:phage-related protein
MGVNNLTVNGIDFRTTYGVYIDGSLSFNKPKKNVETFSIPGRSGDLVIDYGTFQNLVVTYPCVLPENFDIVFKYLVNDLAKMNGYVKIQCTNDPQHYREGVPIIPQTPTVKRIDKDGYFDLSFNCKPFRMLNSGDQNIAQAGSPIEVSNPTGFDAEPLLRFRGYGEISFVNYYGTSYEIFVDQHPDGYITIDCDRMLVASNSFGLNNPQQYVNIVGSQYPKLLRGTTTITYDNTFSEMFIYPRWREL